jgi:hypothetical protein
MTHYDDLTPYEYDEGAPPGAVNIGWLSWHHRYPVGTPPQGLVDALARLAKNFTGAYRGYHVCDLGPRYAEAPCSNTRGDLFMGHAQIHVPGTGGVVYVAPTLVVHYVEAHWYLPPAEFIRAVFEAADLAS